ncbi:RDD family protein [Streptomyces sp. 4N509B]|uniref:RDD family protein n=1 Tax=Streptomyces sp. 4N509B TaxID=3457413 RepID=UPI003FD4EB6A
MSSPPAGNASGAPEPNWYPDPSIPGYIRYWDGTGWVPGSSRPEPRDGEPMPAPPPRGTTTTPAVPAVAASAPTPELPSARTEPDPASGPASGPDDQRDAAPAATPAPAAASGPAAASPSGGAASDAESSALPELRRRADVAPARPESASAWGADARQQQGLGGDRRVTWGSDEDVSTSPVAAAGRVDPRGDFRSTPSEGSTPPPRQDPDAGATPAAGGPPAGPAEPARSEPEGDRPADPATPDPDARERTTALRLSDIQGGAPWRQQVHDLAQQAPQAPASGAPATPPAVPPLSPPSPAAPPAGQAGPAAAPPQQTPGVPPQPQPGGPQPGAPGGYGYPQPGQQPPPGGPQPGAPGGYGFPQPGQQPQPGGPQPGAPGGYGYPQPGQQPQPGGPQPGAPGGYGFPQPGQQPPPQPQPVPGQPGPSGASPFAQPEMLTAMITPRRGDPAFANVGNVYPAGLGRRFLARLVDSLLPLGAAVAIGLPLLDKARDHVQEKIDAAEHAGVTREIWLIDGTTGGYLAIVLGVFLGVSLLFEALPTGLWGRSLGKAACGLRVLDVSRQDKPSFGAALLRWLVYSLLGLVVVGIVNVLWCLGDRPWRQCWHDKAARTFVAAPRR